MGNILFIAWQDVRMQMRQGATLVWVFVMPPIFFYFIGTVTGGFSGTMTGGTATPIAVVASEPGFLKDQLERRLAENDFAAEWFTPERVPQGEEAPPRRLTLDPRFSERMIAGETAAVGFETSANALTRQFEEIRIQRSIYTLLADIIAADARAGTLTPESMVELNGVERVWQLEVESAGQRKKIPTGFEQSVPGILVMFTLLVLLTSGATSLALERQRGMLRRLAATPISRTELVVGKWMGRMALAAVQITVALAFGTWLFNMDWGPDFAMVLLVLAGWAAFCASAAMLLGSVARTEAQAAGLGVLLANVLAALGGCWWPIEITPDWMQAVQNFLPTGWTMDALHKLISFGNGAASALPNVTLLIVGAVVVTALAVNRFRYE